MNIPVNINLNIRPKKKAFTLIELIIVVVIIGILALVAIPRYFANVAKAQKSRVYANLDIIRQAQLAYYTANGVFPVSNSWPIAVTLDGDTITNLANMSDSSWSYYFGASDYPQCTPDGRYVHAYKTGMTCYYALCLYSSRTFGTCTP
jgi:prepilin-type N-terminal cleavage/methylation domain-containing protein